MALLKRASEGESLPVTGVSADRRIASSASRRTRPELSVVHRCAGALQRIIDVPERRGGRSSHRRLLASRRFRRDRVVPAGQGQQRGGEAQLEAKTATQVGQLLESVFRSGSWARLWQHGHRARVLDRAPRGKDRSSWMEPLLQARMMDTIGWVYQTLGLYDQANRRSREALSLRRETSPGITMIW